MARFPWKAAQYHRVASDTLRYSSGSLAFKEVEHDEVTKWGGKIVESNIAVSLEWVAQHVRWDAHGPNGSTKREHDFRVRGQTQPGRAWHESAASNPRCSSFGPSEQAQNTPAECRRRRGSKYLQGFRFELISMIGSPYLHLPPSFAFQIGRCWCFCWCGYWRCRLSCPLFLLDVRRGQI